MIGKLVKGLEVTNFNLPRILRNKVSDVTGAGVNAVEQAAGKASEQGSKSLEHMPTKQDLVIVPPKDRLVCAGPAASPLHQSYGVAGFPEKIREISNAVEKKLAAYIRLIPENSKMTKPVNFVFEGEPVELFVDKTSKNVTRVTLKQSEPAKSVLKEPTISTILDIEFDKSGKMISGSLHIGDSKVSEAYRFTRTGKNMRRLDHENVYKGHSYDSVTYQPDGGTNTWKPIKDNTKNRMGTELPRMSYEYLLDEPLGCLFFKLTELKTTIL